MTERPIPPSATLESALYAEDLLAAETFYSEIIGLSVILRQPGRHVFFRAGQSVLLIFNAAATTQPPTIGQTLAVPPHGSEGRGHYCFSIPAADIDRWCDHLQNKGIAIESDIHWPNGARSIYVRDPAGNSVEFADPALWSQGRY